MAAYHDLFTYSSTWVYPVYLCLIVGSGIFIERMVRLRAATLQTQPFLGDVREEGDGPP